MAGGLPDCRQKKYCNLFSGDFASHPPRTPNFNVGKQFLEVDVCCLFFVLLLFSGFRCRPENTFPTLTLTFGGGGGRREGVLEICCNISFAYGGSGGSPAPRKSGNFDFVFLFFPMTTARDPRSPARRASQDSQARFESVGPCRCHGHFQGSTSPVCGASQA